jgi:hypothetical protein
MAFNHLFFSSISNQQVAGERVQTWQYESVDGESVVTGLNYFADVAKSLKVNDRILIIEMDAQRQNSLRRYAVTVRVNEIEGGTNHGAILALPDNIGTVTRVVTFDDTSTSATRVIDIGKTAIVSAAYGVFLGTVDGTTATLPVSVKKHSAATVVYAGTYTAPMDYGQVLSLAEGTAGTDTAYDVIIAPTGIPANSGSLRVFVVTNA